MSLFQKVIVTLGLKTDNVGAECDCPAGKGPRGSCNIFVVCAVHCKSFADVGSCQIVSFTSRLQEWKKLRQKKFIQSIRSTYVSYNLNQLKVAM